MIALRRLPRAILHSPRQLLLSAVGPCRPLSTLPSHDEEKPLPKQQHVLHASPEMVLNSKRVKGFGRKITLRAINRNVVRRLAKRATIGIPLLGMYFALRVLYNDSKQAFNEDNASSIRRAYAVAATIDLSDVAAQSVIIAGMTTSFFFPEINVFPALAEISPIADKVSLSCALVSSSIGTYCEIRKEEAAELKADLAAEAAETIVPPQSK